MSEYKENPEVKDFPDLDIVYKRFKGFGRVKAKEQLHIYNTISKNWCIGKSVVDVGCGIGIGSNILVREALGVYGIDKSEESIKFAKQMYEGPRLKFGAMDITKPAPRPIGTFDVICAIELIEHVKDFDAVLNGLKQFWDAKRNSVFFISSPNRNNKKIRNESPRNVNHVREWQVGEAYSIMIKHFKAVVMYKWDVEHFNPDETLDGNSDVTPVLFKCEVPIMEVK